VNSAEAHSVMQHDSEELVDVARSLALGASSVATTRTRESATLTVRSSNPFGILDEKSIIEDNDETSLSVRGIPLVGRRRYHLDAWIDTAAPDSTFRVPSNATLSMIEPFPGVYTPPTTSQRLEDLDLEIEIIKRRWEKAIDLMKGQQYKAAIPHISRTFHEFKAKDTNLGFEGAPTYQEVHITLATAMIKGNPVCNEAEPILRDILGSKDTNPLERYLAAHLLAQLLFNLQPQDWTEVKETCIMAIKGRMNTLGRTDARTYESIALLADICQASKDSDEEIWRDMLPTKGTHRVQLDSPVEQAPPISYFQPETWSSLVSNRKKITPQIYSNNSPSQQRDIRTESGGLPQNIEATQLELRSGGISDRSLAPTIPPHFTGAFDFQYKPSRAPPSTPVKPLRAPPTIPVASQGQLPVLDTSRATIQPPSVRINYSRPQQQPTYAEDEPSPQTLQVSDQNLVSDIPNQRKRVKGRDSTTEKKASGPEMQQRKEPYSPAKSPVQDESPKSTVSPRSGGIYDFNYRAPFPHSRPDVTVDPPRSQSNRVEAAVPHRTFAPSIPVIQPSSRPIHPEPEAQSLSSDDKGGFAADAKSKRERRKQSLDQIPGLMLTVRPSEDSKARPIHRASSSLGNLSLSLGQRTLAASVSSPDLFSLHKPRQEQIRVVEIAPKQRSASRSPSLQFHHQQEQQLHHMTGERSHSSLGLRSSQQKAHPLQLHPVGNHSIGPYHAEEIRSL
jgi:ribosomal protein S18